MCGSVGVLCNANAFAIAWWPTVADSLLDRPPDVWLAVLPTASRVTTACAVGFLRYAYHHIEDLASVGGVEAEYARDAWDARRLGLTVRVGHYRVSFARIPQPWLRAAVKAWSRLTGGISFGAIRRE